MFGDLMDCQGLFQFLIFYKKNNTENLEKFSTTILSPEQQLLSSTSETFDSSLVSISSSKHLFPTLETINNKSINMFPINTIIKKPKPTQNFNILPSSTVVSLIKTTPIPTYFVDAMSGEILSSKTTTSPFEKILDHHITNPTIVTSPNTTITDIKMLQKTTTTFKPLIISTVKPMLNLKNLKTEVPFIKTLPTIFTINKLSITTQTTTTTIPPIDRLNLKPIKKNFILHNEFQQYQQYELFTGLCESKTCGDHGECKVVNRTHVFCSCRDYYIGLTCDNCMFIIYCKNKI